jgi:hypothetical protein
VKIRPPRAPPRLLGSSQRVCLRPRDIFWPLRPPHKFAISKIQPIAHLAGGGADISGHLRGNTGDVDGLLSASVFFYLSHYLTSHGKQI